MKGKTATGFWSDVGTKTKRNKTTMQKQMEQIASDWRRCLEDVTVAAPDRLVISSIRSIRFASVFPSGGHEPFTRPPISNLCPENSFNNSDSIRLHCIGWQCHCLKSGHSLHPFRLAALPPDAPDALDAPDASDAPPHRQSSMNDGKSNNTTRPKKKRN